MRIELEQVSPCTGCGKCCDNIGLPPFYVPNPDFGPVPVWHATSDEWAARFLADRDAFERMPAALRAEHAEMVRSLEDDPTGRPCAWLDPDTKRCRHYEYRPVTCREWQPGCDGCNAARRGAKVVWLDGASPGLWLNPRRRDDAEPLTPAGIDRLYAECGGEA